MWVCLAILLTLAPNGMWVQGDAQVLITNRGVPAPFPHFPSVNVVGNPESSNEISEESLEESLEDSSEESESAFQFAPTPTGRVAPAAVTTPEPPSLLATPVVPEDVSQDLGINSIFLQQILILCSSAHQLVHLWHIQLQKMNIIPLVNKPYVN